MAALIAKYSETGEGPKPNHHDRTEEFADRARAEALNRKQRDEYGAGIEGHDDRRGTEGWRWRGPRPALREPKSPV